MALILFLGPDPEPLSHERRVQAPHCRVLWPVKYAQLSGAPTPPPVNMATASMCGRVLEHADIIHAHVHTCCCTHTHTITGVQKHPNKALFTASCSQAVTTGLTCITLNTLPIQLDYTFDSAFIHLCLANRHSAETHLRTHTLFSSHCQTQRPLPSLFLWRLCLLLPQSAARDAFCLAFA